jgi:hypothetical protein
MKEIQTGFEIIIYGVSESKHLLETFIKGSDAET